jgi:hypothetical protein
MYCLHQIQPAGYVRPPDHALASKRRGRYARTLLWPGTAALLVRLRRAMENS